MLSLKTRLAIGAGSVGFGLALASALVGSQPAAAGPAQAQVISDIKAVTESGGRSNMADGVFNPDRGEYVLVWSQVVTYTSGLTQYPRSELFALRVDTAGQAIGSPRQITLLREVGSVSIPVGALWPDIVYNPNTRSYFVAWAVEDRVSQLEIYATYLSDTLEPKAVTGSLANREQAVPIATGSRGWEVNDDALDLRGVAVALNLTTFDYYVTWAAGTGDRSVGRPAPVRVFGVSVPKDGATNIQDLIIQLSPATFQGSSTYFAGSPDITFNPDQNEFLVAWSLAETSAVDQRGFSTVYGQRVDAATRFPIGSSFAISPVDAGGVGSEVASQPQVIYDPSGREYAAAWVGVAARPQNPNGLAGRILVRRFSPTGALTGAPLDAAEGLTGACRGHRPTWVRDPQQDTLALAWWGRESNQGTCPWARRLVVREQWSAGRRLLPALLELSSNDGPSLIEDMGLQAAYNPARGEFLTVWVNEPGTTMPGPQNVVARLLRLDGLQRVYLPAIARSCERTLETEPNNDYATANCVASGLPVQGVYNDDGTNPRTRDFYVFTTTATGTIRVTLSARPERGEQLQLIADGSPPLVLVQDGDEPFSIERLNAPPGRYFIFISAGTEFTSSPAYTLTVNYP